MKCNFKKDIDNGLFGKHIMESSCLLKSAEGIIDKCDGDKCIFQILIQFNGSLIEEDK